jgi:GTP cyclohydrolase II
MRDLREWWLVKAGVGRGPQEIRGFFGQWAFLNSYYPVVVPLDGELYPSVGHAYQAAKNSDPDHRSKIRNTFDYSKVLALGRSGPHREDWNDVRLNIMKSLANAKFTQPWFRQQLLDTYPKRLVDDNDDDDEFWGESSCGGLNHMGRVLMHIREAELAASSALNRSEQSAAPSNPLVRRVVVTRFPTSYGLFWAYTYRDDDANTEHVALVAGEIHDRERVEVRIHSECLTGDVFASMKCECGQQLEAALRRIAEQGMGVLIYLRGQEGRGIGLLAKMRAIELQDTCALDTVDANLALGFPADLRDYGAAAQILNDLGVTSVCLMSNNPDKIHALRRNKIVVDDVIPLLAEPHPENYRYLRTKRDRLGHRLTNLVTSEADVEKRPTG